MGRGCTKEQEYDKMLEMAKLYANKEGKAMVVYLKSCGGADISRKEDFTPEGKSRITVVLPKL